MKCLLFATLAFVTLIFVSIGEAKTIVEPMQAVAVTRKGDLLKITSNYPISLEVKNRSDKNVSGFSIEIFAAEDEGGPMKILRWGVPANSGYKQEPLLKPGESVKLAIPENVVKTLYENGKPFLYIQLAQVWVNNDPSIMYSHGRLLQRDPEDPNRYIVVGDSKDKPVDRQP